MNKGSEGDKLRRETDALQRAITAAVERLRSFIDFRAGQLKGGAQGVYYAQNLITLTDFVDKCEGLTAKVAPTLNELKVLNKGLAQVVEELSGNNNLPEAMEKLGPTMKEAEVMISTAEARQVGDIEALRKELNVGDLNLSHLDAAMKKTDVPSPSKSTRPPAGQKAARQSGWSHAENPRVKREAKPRPRSGWSGEDTEESRLNPRIKQEAKPRPVSGWSGEDTEGSRLNPRDKQEEKSRRTSGWSGEDKEGSRLTQVGQAPARGSLKRESSGPQSEPAPKRPASMRAMDWSKLEGKINAVESSVKGNAEFEGKIKKLRDIAEKIKGVPAGFPEINKMLDSVMSQYKKAVDQAEPKGSQSKK